MKQIAFYGKGGIGKSTITANLAAAMALSGRRVLQVGCDPKQDSTRLLLGGERALPILDYLRRTKPADRSLDAIVRWGFARVACVEAGGPEPGVGCAGRGILTAFELMESLNIASCEFDVTLYDILGDVVCGGFALPLREKYADFVYIVTSGEFMSLYAANNILRGVRNFERGACRMAGLIFNQRGLADEEKRMRRFADAVRLPIVASFPRSREIEMAERLGRTIAEADAEGTLAAQFRELAAAILQFSTPYPALPLSADDLEATILATGAAATRKNNSHEQPFAAHAPEPASAPPHRTPSPLKRYRSRGVEAHAILHGCAFNGAVHTVLQIRNAAVLAHGPRSCTFLSHLGSAARAVRRGLRDGRKASAFDPGMHPSLHSSEMDDTVAIFGGGDRLEEGIARALKNDPEALFVVTTCASGIIGDDIGRSAAAAAAKIGTKIPIIPIQTDGAIAGDYMQGVINAAMTVAEHYIEPETPIDPEGVNIVGEKNLGSNTESNFLEIAELLAALGLRVNCRFVRDCTGAQLRGFMRGRLNLLASGDRCGRAIRDFLVDRYQAEFLPGSFPVGFEAAAAWLTGIAAMFNREGEAARIIEERRDGYREAISLLRPSLSGKRVLIATPVRQIDWLLDVVQKLDMEILKIGIMDSTWDDGFVTRYDRRFPVAFSYTQQQRDEDVQTLEPDLLLTNGSCTNLPPGVRVDAIPLVPDAGFWSGLTRAERWRRLLQLPQQEGWRHDLL